MMPVQCQCSSVNRYGSGPHFFGCPVYPYWSIQRQAMGGDLAAAAGGAIYLYILSRELALTCFSVTVLLWAVALRYGAFTRKAQRAYQDGLAETNEVQPACLPVVALI